MNNKLNVLLAAGVLALAACNSPTAEQKADEAGDQAAVAADAAGDAAAASAEAAAAAGAAAVGSAAAAVDAAADPVQAAYEEGKANAAGAIADGAQNVADSMGQEAAEAEATAETEKKDCSPSSLHWKGPLRRAFLFCGPEPQGAAVILAHSPSPADPCPR